jgi:quercetin dioxygenase-like cupin family protein
MDNRVVYTLASSLGTEKLMPTPRITASQARVTATPNAIMTTLASPELSGSQSLSLWTTTMEAGSAGPVHRFQQEQIWMLTGGRAVIEIDGQAWSLEAGDTLTIPGQQQRQVRATTRCTFTVCGFADAPVSVPGEEPPRPTPPWIV